ncbi:protein kinase 4-like [Sitodiplosis mosellana]|uniref:protein kinase 4-like n=1 Tax=Sitodiplosis mosellana TaxID=263140 RepID=UPI002443799F|nr:protein kinase 4-like [Sitodiplosis mosellana]
MVFRSPLNDKEKETNSDEKDKESDDSDTDTIKDVDEKIENIDNPETIPDRNERGGAFSLTQSKFNDLFDNFNLKSSTRYSEDLREPAQRRPEKDIKDMNEFFDNLRISASDTTGPPPKPNRDSLKLNFGGYIPTPNRKSVKFSEVDPRKHLSTIAEESHYLSQRRVLDKEEGYNTVDITSDDFTDFNLPNQAMSTRQLDQDATNDYEIRRQFLRRLKSIPKFDEVLTSQLENMRQEKDESLAKYAERARKMLQEKNSVYKVLTEDQKLEHNRMARKAFAKGIQNGKLKTRLITRGASSLEDAIAYAIEAENDELYEIPKQELYCKHCRSNGHRENECRIKNANNNGLNTLVSALQSFSANRIPMRNNRGDSNRFNQGWNNNNNDNNNNNNRFNNQNWNTRNNNNQPNQNWPARNNNSNPNNNSNNNRNRNWSDQRVNQQQPNQNRFPQRNDNRTNQRLSNILLGDFELSDDEYLSEN